MQHKKKPTDRRAYFVEIKFICLHRRFTTVTESLKIVGELFLNTKVKKHIHKKQRFFVYRFRFGSTKVQ